MDKKSKLSELYRKKSDAMRPHTLLKTKHQGKYEESNNAHDNIPVPSERKVELIYIL